MKKLLLSVAAALLAGTVAASPARITPQSIIVNPAPSTDLSARVWVDRDPGGRGTSTYRVGDQIRISVSVNRNAYVYLFNINSSGEVNLILPNAYAGGASYLYANEVRTFPASNAGFRFTVDGPSGIDRVLAVASSEPLDMSTLYSAAGGGFYDVQVQGQQNLARALSIVVEPVPARAWVTASIQYYVRW